MKNNTFKLTGYVAILTALLLQACSVQETQKENKSADIASINENKHADMEQRIKALLAKMTLEQKIGQMLQPEIIKSYAKQATGEKYLVNPHK